MSSKKGKMKRLSDSDSDSGPDDRLPPPPKRSKAPEPKKKAAAAAADSDEETMFKLSKMRFVSVSEFRGKVLVNIREYYSAADGDLKPGKKGISLSTEQWEALKGHIESIDDAIKKF